MCQQVFTPECVIAARALRERGGDQYEGVVAAGCSGRINTRDGDLQTAIAVADNHARLREGVDADVRHSWRSNTKGGFRRAAPCFFETIWVVLLSGMDRRCFRVAGFGLPETQA